VKTLRPDRCRLSAEPTRTEPSTGVGGTGASERAHGQAWGPGTGRGSARARGSETGLGHCKRTGGPGARGPSERSKRAVLGPASLSPLGRPRPLAHRCLATRPASPRPRRCLGDRVSGRPGAVNLHTGGRGSASGLFHVTVAAERRCGRAQIYWTQSSNQSVRFCRA
jgi:hypothetical protein